MLISEFGGQFLDHELHIVAYCEKFVEDVFMEEKPFLSFSDSFKTKTC